MSFCRKCGAKIADDSMFCPRCGASLEDSTQHMQANGQQADFSEKISAFNETADTTDQFDAQDIQNNKAMAILAYIGILVLIPLFVSKESKFARFHINQGLILFIVEIAYAIAYGIVSAIIFAISWRLFFITSILGIVGLVFLVLSIIGIVNAANGKAKELPIIGKFKILK